MLIITNVSVTMVKQGEHMNIKTTLDYNCVVVKKIRLPCMSLSMYGNTSVALFEVRYDVGMAIS